MMKYTLLLLFLPFLASAQVWQWGARGGSTNQLQRPRDYNNVTEIATDSAGNIYTLGPVGASGLKVKNQSLVAYSATGGGSTKDILLASFSAKGNLRWTKVIGATFNDVGHSLKTDAMGNVYVAGLVFNPQPNPSNTAIHFDTDSVLPQTSKLDSLKKIMFLVKYDTAGNFGWLRMPEPDTVSLSLSASGTNNSVSYKTDVDPVTGEVYWFCFLRKGEFAWNGNNNIITQKGEYVLRYDAQGDVTERTLLDIQTEESLYRIGEPISFARCPATRRYYIGGINDGTEALVINGDTIRDRMYLACFDSTGALLWKREGTPSSPSTAASNGINDIKVGQGGNVYVCGFIKSGSQFNGHNFTSPQIHSSPFIAAMDKNGNHLWAKMGVANAQSAAHSLAVSDSEVALAGYAAQLWWPGETDTAQSAANQGYDGFLARFRKSDGSLITMERTQTDFGGAAYAHAVAAGKNKGEYYVGGNFSSQLFLGPDTLFKVGSQRSFFVGKYACDLPEVGFSVSGMNADTAATFLWTGGAADSIWWTFGDGSAAQLGDTVSHSFPAKGNFFVCARAFFGCAEKYVCDTVAAGSISLREFGTAESGFELFPNPARQSVNVEYFLKDWTAESKAKIAIYDLRGAKLFEQPLTRMGGKENLQLPVWSDGLYLVVLRYDGEVVGYERLVIQNN